MDVTQISVFIENRPGRAAEVCRTLEGAGVNVRGFMISDTNDYGILRLVVDDPERALSTLEANGYAAKAKPVLVARLVDEPGNLSRLLEGLSAAGVNLVYAYSLISTYVAIAATDLDAVRAVAGEVGIELVDLPEIASWR